MDFIVHCFYPKTYLLAHYTNTYIFKHKYLQIKTIILWEYGRRGLKYECEEKNTNLVLLASHTAQFPPTVKSDSGETKATETSSQFSNTLNHSKFQRTMKCV